jgi:hypothetical protein
MIVASTVLDVSLLRNCQGSVVESTHYSRAFVQDAMSHAPSPALRSATTDVGWWLNLKWALLDTLN